MENYIVLALNHYSFTDKDTGEVKEGVTLFYLDSTPLDEENKKGFFPLKISLPLELVSKIKKVPARYNFDFGMKAGKDNKPQLYVKDVSFVEEFKF